MAASRRSTSSSTFLLVLFARAALALAAGVVTTTAVCPLAARLDSPLFGVFPVSLALGEGATALWGEPSENDVM